MIAREGLGVGHQFPTLLTELIHQTHQGDSFLRMASGNQLTVIEPEFLNLTGPALAARHKPQLRVLPLHRHNPFEKGELSATAGVSGRPRQENSASKRHGPAPSGHCGSNPAERLLRQPREAV